jgi:SAM-dependent methyltransferase
LTTADFSRKEKCRLCDGEQLQTAVRLTPTPPGNNFLEAHEIGEPEALYPLELCFCTDCAHVQLGHVVAPEILYQKNYTYVSGTSPVFVRHLEEYASAVASRFSPPQGCLVVDIGSNDGTCLRAFKQGGYRVLGVDPATQIARRASAAGIETIPAFFSEALAADLKASHGSAYIITSHNACAHIDDLQGVVNGVKHWLHDDGLFIFEVGYLLDVVENLWFDTIYHEHVDFHSVKPLVRFFEGQGMEVIGVERISPQGGSIRVIVQKASGCRLPSSTVSELVALEESVGLDQITRLEKFSRSVEVAKSELTRLLADLKSQGKTIAGYGAPTKATTLLTHFQLGDGALDFIVDDNPLKAGLFSPLHHIPVVPAEEIYHRRPDCLLILAWNFAESIMEKHARYREGGGTFIIPMPVPRVILPPEQEMPT